MTLNVMFKLSNIWILECNTMLLSNCGKKYTIIFKLWIRTRSYIYIMNHDFTFNFFSNKTKFAWYIFAVRCFLLTLERHQKHHHFLYWSCVLMKILLKTDRNTKKHSNIDNVCSNLLFTYCFMKILPVLVLFCLVNIWLLYLCDNQHFLQVLFVGLLMILKQYNINHVNTSISCSTCSQPSCTIIISVIFILLSMYIKFNQSIVNCYN